MHGNPPTLFPLSFNWNLIVYSSHYQILKRDLSFPPVSCIVNRQMFSGLPCISCIHLHPVMTLRALNHDRFFCLLQAGSPGTKVYPLMIAVVTYHKAAWEFHIRSNRTSQEYERDLSEVRKCPVCSGWGVSAPTNERTKKQKHRILQTRAPGWFPGGIIRDL